MQTNLTLFKLCYGPMSKEIMNILSEYSYEVPLMIVSSRNQVDYVGGYVCDQNYLSSILRNNPNILICRDHCGPYFKDTDKSLSISAAIEECKKTIAADIDAGFDLIHIDVSKVEDSFKVADELIEFTLKLKPDILIEFGSEENTGKNLDETFAHLDDQLNYCKQYKENIKFFVSQTGSFIKDNQLGSFNIEYNKKIADKIHQAGFLFKEHNGDYLSTQDLKLRKIAGVDAINVAPQLGVIQTELLFKMSNNSVELQNFKDCVYKGNKYQRWLDASKYSIKDEAVRVSGHYFFGSPEYKILVNSIDPKLFFKHLRNNIFKCLDTYREFYK